MDWLRLWHDMPTDPKWRVIAKRSGQTIPTVIAVYNFLLVNASANANERGRTHNFNDEDVAAALDISEAEVRSIIDAMQGRVLDGEYLTGWAKRQPKREDGASERAKQWRERTRTQTNASERTRTDENANETAANASERPDTDTDTDTDIITPPSPLKGALKETAKRLHANHPAARRDIGVGQIEKHLRAILRHKPHRNEKAIAYLGELADRHQRWCQSSDWTKDDGQFAKGLDNWLAPTKDRYEQEPTTNVCAIPAAHKTPMGAAKYENYNPNAEFQKWADGLFGSKA